MPNIAAMARAEAMGAMPPARKGGVVTITRTATDTGERKDMLGFKARHIKSSMSMESSPDACNQSHMKMEIDGWYADISAGFSCGGDESYRAMACGGPAAARGCTDRIVMKGSGGGALGYPLKQTMTMTSEQGTFTTTTEVVELQNTSLDASLFEAPAGCRNLSAMMGGAPAAKPAESEPPAAPAPAAAPEPAAPAAAALAPKAAGVLRIGVVKIKDMSGQSLPTDNLRMNLMSELARQQMEPVPLNAESPQQDVEAEARAKQCDYFVYTTANQVSEPGGSGLAAAALPKGVKLDPAKFQALSGITLYKVGKPLPEIKDLPLAADADRFVVDAVMETFVQESDRVAKQIEEDRHPKPAAAKAPAKPAGRAPARPAAKKRPQ